MAEISITARVRRDGTLELPRQAREILGLQEGDRDAVTLTVPDKRTANSNGDPLLELIGIGQGGPADGAEDHDSRLYRSSWA